ncbi:hypothetical protein [Terasakiella sp.]|uniref:hypothetical protein n=1 Tax=Terasakiella sp. TaxID=2034861 RepID=UPI003AA9222D
MTATKSTRPRGFISGWTPRKSTQELIDSVKAILEDNSDILPLTLRQIFYMLVSNYNYDKTEQAYGRLCETMNRARRAQMVDMSSIRDDGLRREAPQSWSGEDSIIETFKSYSYRFRLDRQRDQPRRLMVWCEAGGMLPQLARYCDEWGIPVLSSGGFDSVTTKHNFAREVSGYNAAVHVFHIGDHDPSGVHMCSSLDEDVRAFVGHYGGDFTIERLAVTPDQVREMGLSTAPPKKTDRRTFSGLTTQAEAIPPRELKRIVTEAIEGAIDFDAYEEVLAEENNIKASLSERLENL